MQYADAKCQCTELYNPHIYRFSGPCIISGNTIEVDIPGEELFNYRQGKMIQDAMPSLTPDEREFLMSGISATEWGNVFPEPEEAANE